MSENIFWSPSADPVGKELQRSVLSAFAHNLFSEQHSAAVRESSQLQRKRVNRESENLSSEEQLDGVGTPFLPLLEMLLRVSGVPYASRQVEADLPSRASGNGVQDNIHYIVEPLPTTVCCTTASEKPKQPKSALAALVESARAKEKQRRSEGPETSSRIVSLTEQSTVVDRAFSRSAAVTQSSQVGGEEAEDEFGVLLPPVPSTSVVGLTDGGTTNAKHPSQMSQEEFLRQFKRAPRRGEIGYDADNVAAAEAVGYVMSGSRNKEKQHYVDSIQRKLHEKEARKLRLQFRKVEDERNDNATIETLLALVRQRSASGGGGNGVGNQ